MSYEGTLEISSRLFNLVQNTTNDLEDYLPVYFQNVRGYSPILSAALTIPLVANMSVFSICSGQYISRTKRYGEIIWSGYVLWALGSGLMLLFSRATPKWQIIVFLLIEGGGVGFTFQPSLVALQAHSTKRDRAVVISTRNFLRAMGGSFGLAISSAVFSHSLKKSLDSSTPPLPAALTSSILESILSVPDVTSVSSTERTQILDSYMDASRALFILWMPFMAVCLLLCLLIKDNGLTRPEEKPQSPEIVETSETETRNAGESDVEMQIQAPSKKD